MGDSPGSGAQERQGGRFGSPLVVSLALLGLTVLFGVQVGQQYFLTDDSFISFRYARHLAEGEGLVWNPGERVEGYTNFLWVVLMAAFLRVGAAPEIAANVLGILSGCGVLAVVFGLSKHLFDRRDPFVWIAPFALASSASFAAWCTGGLETMFFALLVLGGSWLSIVEHGCRSSSSWPWSAVVFGLATWTRPDAALFAFVAALFLLADCCRGTRSWRAGITWVACYGTLVGAHLLFRHTYYGEWLPNTFHAKVPGAWWEQGGRYLQLFLNDYRFSGFLPLIVLAAVLRRGYATLLLLASLTAHLVYVAAVGGDRFEIRFLIVVLPSAYLLIAVCLSAIANRAAGANPARRALRRACMLVALALPATALLAGQRPESSQARHGVVSLKTIRDYADRRSAEGRFLRELVDEGLLPDDVVICVGGAGAVPYYSGLPTVDRRGLNDAYIARLPMGSRGVVAHERDAPFEYLAERGVVMFDFLNRLVHDRDISVGRSKTIVHDGREMPIVVVRARGRFLIFATAVSRAEINRVFRRMEVVSAG